MANGNQTILSDVSNATEESLRESSKQTEQDRKEAYSRRIEEIVRTEIFSDFKFISSPDAWDEESEFFRDTIDLVEGNTVWRNDPENRAAEWKAFGKYARSVLNQKRNNAQQQCKVKYLSKLLRVR